MTSTPGSRKPASKTKRSRPAPASPVRPAAQDARSNRGARLSVLEARVGALESELKKSERRLQREIGRRERAESDLRQSEARYQSLAAFGDHHLFVMDPKGRYLFSNREQGLSVGGERLPFVGRNQKEFHPREVAGLYEDRMRAVLETGRAVEFEHVAPEPDGLHEHLDTLYPIEENGRIVALGGICRDITEEKNTRHRLQHALDATAEGVWDWNIRTGDVVFSRNWKTSLGYSPDEVTDRIEFWESIVHPEDLPRVRQALDDHLSGRTPLYVCENRLRMKSGEYRANLDRGKVVERDASGQPLRMVGTDTDVSERRKAMDDLLQAKNDLEAIFNAIRQAVFLMEPEGRVVSANEEVARRLGCEVKDLVGRSIYEFLPPGIAAGRSRRVAEVLRSGRPVQFEDVRAGRTILQTVYPVFDSHDAVVRLAVYGQDVTEERRSEAGLRESEERYRRIVETANEGVWAMDGEYVTTYVNRRMADMLGYRPEEMVGSRVDTFMFAEDLHDHSARMAVRQMGGGSVYERRFRRKDGGEVWTLVSATALKGEDGRFAGSFAMFTDITLRKQAEESSRLYERMAAASADSMALVGRDYVYKAVNEAFLKRVGLPREQVVNRHPAEILGRELFESVLRPRLDRCLQGETVVFSEWFTYPDLGRRCMEVCYSPYREPDGGITGVVLNARDSTERKRLEEILQARLRLSEAAGALTLEELLQQALDEAERITASRIGFIHFVEPDERSLSLQMWSTNTLRGMCTAEGKGRHYSVDNAGVWVDCIRDRRPVIHNDYVALPHRRGLPPGHAPVVRELVVPILRNERIVAVVGVGNKPENYDLQDVEVVSALANLAWDIVLRKRAEEQLELQGMVLDQARDRVTITHLDGVIRYVNEAECRALRRPRSELIGRHVGVLGEDPERGATQREIIESTLNRGEWRGEVINHSADGDESIVDLRTFMVRSNAGRSIAMCGIGTDITERKRTEAALRESEALLRTIMASTAEGVLVVDLEGRVLLASQRFNELWQIPQGLMAEGRDDTLLRHVVGQFADPELFLERVRRIYASDVASLDTIRFKDGRVFERFSQPLVRDGRRAGRTWSFRDVTARVQAEVELRESQAKLRGLYNQVQNAREEERRRISRELHDELGQNITALKIDLAWLAHRMDPGRPALLEKLASMSGIVDATLDTARRVSAELRPGVLDSLGLAAAAEWLVRDFEKRHEVECSLRIVPDEIEVTPGLATDVFRILQETLTNVARHARAARVEVTLRQEEDMIELHVTDNGVGIEPDRVTSPGSLGLLGIRERLLPYPGALVVEAAPGGGTSVRVTIPIEARAD